MHSLTRYRFLRCILRSVHYAEVRNIASSALGIYDRSGAQAFNSAGACFVRRASGIYLVLPPSPSSSLYPAPLSTKSVTHEAVN